MTMRSAAPLAVPLAIALAVALLLSAGGRAAGQKVGDPVLVGAGDIADCNSTYDEKTATLLKGIDGTVATLGDNAYEDGTLDEYNNCYDPTWGQFKARTMPSLGNHEYYTADASGYFDYFSESSTTSPTPVPNTPENPGLTPGKGYYSYDLGSWHVVVLNSNCDEVDCETDSDQVKWLEADLAANSDKECTLAYFHDPRFSSSGFGNDGIDDSAVEPFWQALYDADAELVLNGHRHNYERFAPQTPDGVADPAKGIREFVVGTGGEKLMSFKNTADNSEAGDDNTYGVLKLTLHPTGYDWEFVPVAGESFTDSGSGSCHGAPSPSPADTKAPRITSTVPAANATGVSPTSNVKATFSEDMEASSIKDTTFKLKERGSSTNLPAKVTYDASTRTATLNPTSLLSGRTYKAVVTTRAKDLAGNRLDQDGATTGFQQKTWLLKVDNAKAPRITSTVPAANATGVSPTSNVKATFSEDMEASSIKDTTFKLKERGSSTNLPAKVTYDASTRAATLNPTTSLRRGVTYEALVTTQAKDLAGNQLDQDGATTGFQQKTWSFKVGN